MICYENRNGMVAAYDPSTQSWLNPDGDDFEYAPAAENEVRDFAPEEIRDALVARGETHVLVYTGKNPSWVNGQILGSVNRLRKFGHLASQSPNQPGAWTEVSVDRIGDGSDWSDIYTRMVVA